MSKSNSNQDYYRRARDRPSVPPPPGTSSTATPTGYAGYDREYQPLFTTEANPTSSQSLSRQNATQLNRPGSTQPNPNALPSQYTSTYESAYRPLVSGGHHSGSRPGTAQPQAGSSYFQPRPTHHSSRGTPGIVKQLVKFIQSRVFVCSNQRCRCRPGRITSGHRWPFLTIQRASKHNSVPGPETCVPIDVELEGELRGVPFNHSTLGQKMRCPIQMVKSYDIYHGPVDHILIRNLTEQKALDIIQALADCDREAQVFKYLSCHLFVEKKLNELVAGGIAKMSGTVDQALLNVKNALGEDTPTAEEVLDNAPVTSNSSWPFRLPDSIPPRPPSASALRPPNSSSVRPQYTPPVRPHSSMSAGPSYPSSSGAPSGSKTYRR